MLNSVKSAPLGSMKTSDNGCSGCDCFCIYLINKAEIISKLYVQIITVNRMLFLGVVGAALQANIMKT